MRSSIAQKIAANLHFYLTRGKYDIKKSEDRRQQVKAERNINSIHKILNYSSIAEYKHQRELKADQAATKCFNQIFCKQPK